MNWVDFETGIRTYGEPVGQHGGQFSFWPSKRTQFVTNPWVSCKATLRKTGVKDEDKNLAVAFLDQSEQYYRAANSASIVSTKPVLYYYSFLNMAKAFLYTRGLSVTGVRTVHGLVDKRGSEKDEITNAILTTDQKKSSAFSLFSRALANNEIEDGKEYKISDVLPEMILGHRMWAECTGKDEQFIAANGVWVLQESGTNRLYLNVTIEKSDIKRLSISKEELLKRARIENDFHQVPDDSGLATYGDYITLRSRQALNTSSSIDSASAVDKLASRYRQHFWSLVTSVPSYRRYYFFVPPEESKCLRLHQLLSIYLVFYYLGSVTRYRPHKFEAILQGTYGPLVEEIIFTQPNQFLYLLASEFAQQDLARGATI